MIETRIAANAAAAMTCAFAITLAAAPAGGGAPKFTISVPVKQGDSLPPYGTITNINDISVNNQGEWLVEVSLTGGTANGALIRNGEVWLAVGDFLPVSIFLPISAEVSSLSNVLKDLNNEGDVALRPSLMGTPNSGIYFNMTPLLVDDQVSTAPEFSPGTPYIGFFRARVNDNDDVFAIATVNDAALPGSVHRALVWLDYDPKTLMVTEDVLFKRDDPAPGTEAGVTFLEFGTDAARFAISNNRDALFVADFTGAPPETAGGIYINDQLIVRKSDPSPIAGSVFITLGSSTRAHMNNNLDYVFIGGLTNQPASSTNVIAAGNGKTPEIPPVIFSQQGDAAPDVPGETITSFGTGVQPRMTDAGSIVWYGQISGDSTMNQGLFVDDQLILRKGQTIPGQGVLTTVAGTTALSNGIGQGFTTSGSGRFVMVRTVLDSGPRAAVLIDLGPDCAVADLNCDGVVDGLDLGNLLANWSIPAGSPGCGGAVPCAADLNVDGVVDGIDLGILLANWTL